MVIALAPSHAGTEDDRIAAEAIECIRLLAAMVADELPPAAGRPAWTQLPTS